MKLVSGAFLPKLIHMCNETFLGSRHIKNSVVISSCAYIFRLAYQCMAPALDSIVEMLRNC